MMETVSCPRCKRQQPKRGGHDTIYWCEWCRIQFDDEPLEGGDYHNRNPAWRLEREEAKKRRSKR